MSTNNMDRFEFRCIRPEETQQAIEIEQICFPPNEACSPKSLTERIKATAETFLVAEDKETGKLAAFLNGVPTDVPIVKDNAVAVLTVTALPPYQGIGPFPLRRCHAVGCAVRPAL